MPCWNPSERLSDRLDGWFSGPGPKTVGSLTSSSARRASPCLFVLLLALSALPLPTGGVTHVFELIAMLLALELIAVDATSGCRNAGGSASSGRA